MMKMRVKMRQGNLESGVEEDVVEDTEEYEGYGYESTFEVESEAERLEGGELEELSDSGLEDEDDDEDEDILDEWEVEARVWGEVGGEVVEVEVIMNMGLKALRD